MVEPVSSSSSQSQSQTQTTQPQPQPQSPSRGQGPGPGPGNVDVHASSTIHDKSHDLQAAAAAPSANSVDALAKEMKKIDLDHESKNGSNGHGQQHQNHSKDDPTHHPITGTTSAAAELQHPSSLLPHTNSHPSTTPQQQHNTEGPGQGQGHVSGGLESNLDPAHVSHDPMTIQSHPPSASASASEPIKLFIGQVPRHLGEPDLHKLFSPYGTIVELTVLRDKHTQAHRGCAFLTYSTRASADHAIQEVHEKLCLHNRPIVVRYAGMTHAPVECKLFVGMLNRATNEERIRSIFEAFGPVKEVYLMRESNVPTQSLPSTSPPSGPSGTVPTSSSSTSTAVSSSSSSSTPSSVSKGCAFVKMQHRSDAERAIHALHDCFQDPGAPRKMVVRFAESKSSKMRNAWATSFMQQQAVAVQVATAQAHAHAAAAAGNPVAAANIMASAGGATQPGSDGTGAANTNAALSPHMGPHYVGAVWNPYVAAAGAFPPAPGQAGRGGAAGGRQGGGGGGTSAAVVMSPYGAGAPFEFSNGGMPPTFPPAMYDPTMVPGAGNAANGVGVAGASGGGHASHHPGGGPRGPPGSNLFVYSLPESFTDLDLQQLFMHCGAILSTHVYRDKMSGRSRGFGFVSFDAVSSAEKAIASLNGYQVGGKRLKVMLKGADKKEKQQQQQAAAAFMVMQHQQQQQQQMVMQHLHAQVAAVAAAAAASGPLVNVALADGSSVMAPLTPISPLSQTESMATLPHGTNHY